MGRCIVHFGMHKTGSTSVQLSLHRNLRDPGFHYVDLGVANASRPIVTAFARRPKHYHRNVRRGLERDEIAVERERMRGLLAEQLREAGERTAIISGEDIADLGERELRTLCTFITAHASDVRAVAYVRAPHEFMASMFQQRLKGGASGLNPARLFPRYRARLGHLSAVFGEQRVSFWRYAPERFEHGCVVRDFCARIGIDFDPGGVVRRNVGLSLPAIKLLFAFRRFGPPAGGEAESARQNKRLVARLRLLRGPGLRFHSSVVMPLLEAHGRSVAWMNARLDSPFPSVLPVDTEDSVAGEGDLLTFPAHALEWLAAQPQVRASGWKPIADPVSVAGAVRLLCAGPEPASVAVAEVAG